MSFNLLDRAVEIRKSSGRHATKSIGSEPNNDSRGASKDDHNFHDIQAESSYFLLSQSSVTHGSSGILSPDSDYLRSGRWTNEEMEFVDFLLHAFDQGTLPIPLGFRLNEFLCKMLLCKASRLTKKMKNARLSSKSYQISMADPLPALDCEMLSSLQEKFLQSIPSEATQLELRFNITKVWRSNLSNLCVQAGCSMLDASAWVASVDEAEHRAAQAEEKIRGARRRRMGLALKTDSRTAQTGVYFAGVPVQRPGSSKQSKTVRTTALYAVEPSPSTLCSMDGAEQSIRGRGDSVSVNSVSSSDDGTETDNFISNMLDLGNSAGTGLPRANSVDDFSQIFNSLIDDPKTPADGARDLSSPASNTGNNTFLEEVVTYMQLNNLPFEHVDVWVPSYTAKQEGGKNEELRLYHAGYATRGDLESALYCQLQEYGVYSTKFSFAPGCGLPGRVYESGKPSWERKIDEADPTYFERAGGARVYGVKTGVGFPISTQAIGRIVVSMYSIRDLNEDLALVNKWASDVSAYCPEPKWKLVVEMGSSEVAQTFDSPTGQPAFPGSVQQTAGGMGEPSSDAFQQFEILTSSGTATFVPGRKLSTGSRASTERVLSPNEGQHDEDICIATLLGDYMPLSEGTHPGDSATSSSNETLLLPAFMSLRLMLLRSRERRSSQENDLIDIIRKSYRGYAQDSRRSEKDVACLLVKDWQYLQMTMSETDLKKPAAEKSSQDASHQCHVMDLPAMSTYSSSGAPVRMPSQLSLVHPATVRKSSSCEDLQLGSKKRRISSFDEKLETVPTKIIDDN
jgi:hypothetical protein